MSKAWRWLRRLFGIHPPVIRNNPAHDSRNWQRKFQRELEQVRRS